VPGVNSHTARLAPPEFYSMAGRIFVTACEGARDYKRLDLATALAREHIRHRTSNAWRIAASNGIHQVVFRHGIKRPHTESAFVNSN